MPAKSILKQSTGKDFEKLLEACFEGYRTRGIALIRKVDPPVRVMGPPKHRRVIFLENPWLDYCGTWTEAGGRAIMIEAKSTEDERLSIGGNGVSVKQIENLIAWHRAGAAVAIVWHHRGNVRVIAGETIKAAHEMGLKSFKWRHFRPPQKREGWIIWDILSELSACL